MAAKRKKSDELWLTTKSNDNLNSNYKNQFELNVEKYLELKQIISELEEEKDKNLIKIKQLEDTIKEQDNRCTIHLNQLTELKELINNLEIKLDKKNEQYDFAIKELENNKNYFNKQEEKWKIFQTDLLTTVRVANDLKTEAEEQSETLLNENKTLTEKITNLETELNKLRLNNDNQINNQIDENNLNIKNDSQYFYLKDKKISQQYLVNDKNLNNNLDKQNSELDNYKIVFRKRIDDKQLNSKRNASCFTELNNKLNKYDHLNGNQLNNNEESNMPNLFRQQSADSVFSSIKQQDKLNLRNSTQSLKGVLEQSKSLLNKKISVRTLVETIENKNNQTSSSTNLNQNLLISKSPSFNSINLNDKSSIKSTFDCNITKNCINNGLIESKDQFNDKNDKLINKFQNNDNKLDSIDDKFITKQDKSSTTKLNDKLNKLDKLDKLELIKTRLNTKKNAHTLQNKQLNNHLIDDKNALNNLIKDGGSRRNKLLKWCQEKLKNYDIVITNFSSSWTDSLAFCALLHSLDNKLIPFHTLDKNNKKQNFTIAFNAAKSIGIPTTLNIEDLINEERPDWSNIMAYISSIYNHFEK